MDDYHSTEYSREGSFWDGPAEAEDIWIETASRSAREEVEFTVLAPQGSQMRLGGLPDMPWWAQSHLAAIVLSYADASVRRRAKSVCYEWRDVLRDETNAVMSSLTSCLNEGCQGLVALVNGGDEHEEFLARLDPPYRTWHRPYLHQLRLRYAKEERTEALRDMPDADPPASDSEGDDGPEISEEDLMVCHGSLERVVDKSCCDEHRLPENRPAMIECLSAMTLAASLELRKQRRKELGSDWRRLMWHYIWPWLVVLPPIFGLMNIPRCLYPVSDSYQSSLGSLLVLMMVVLLVNITYGVVVVYVRRSATEPSQTLKMSRLRPRCFGHECNAIGMAILTTLVSSFYLSYLGSVEADLAPVYNAGECVPITTARELYDIPAVVNFNTQYGWKRENGTSTWFEWPESTWFTVSTHNESSVVYLVPAIGNEAHGSTTNTTNGTDAPATPQPPPASMQCAPGHFRFTRIPAMHSVAPPGPHAKMLLRTASQYYADGDDLGRAIGWVRSRQWKGAQLPLLLPNSRPYPTGSLYAQFWVVAGLTLLFWFAMVWRQCIVFRRAVQDMRDVHPSIFGASNFEDRLLEQQLAARAKIGNRD